MSKPVEKPPIQRERSWGQADNPRDTQMKESILRDVDKMRVDQGKKSGGV